MLPFPRRCHGKVGKLDATCLDERLDEVGIAPQRNDHQIGHVRRHRETLRIVLLGRLFFLRNLAWRW